MDIKTKDLRQQVSESYGRSGTDHGVPEQEEIEDLVQEVVSKELVNAVNVKVNEALMELLSQEVNPENDTKSAEKKSDSAEFSNESLAYNRNTEEEALRQRELERLLDKIWEILEGWQSQPGVSLSAEIKELQDIYQKLLHDIMKFYTHDQAGMQADRMNALLLKIIDKISNIKYPNLLFLLERYGENGAGDFLQASVLRRITGKAVSPQEVAAARELVMRKGQISRPLEAGGGPGGVRGVREDGILYGKGHGNRIHSNQRYREDVKAEEQFHLRSGQGGKCRYTVGGVQHFRGKTYTIEDIERTEPFLNYVSNKGNLYSNPGLTARNDELLGFLMAVNMVKTQIYAEYAGVSKGMAMDVQNALERLFRFYLTKSINTASVHGTGIRDGGKDGMRPDSKAIQRMYYRVMELIHQMKTPGKGIEKGLKYAWETFISKKESGQHKENRCYQQKAGFFSNDMEYRDGAAEVKHGARILDQDWKEFLTSIRQDHNHMLQIMLYNCPWGMILEPEAGPKNLRPSSTAVMVLVGTVILTVLVVLAGVILKGFI